MSVGGARLRLRTWFPDREFFMRSQGQVRFIKVSSRLQMAVAGGVAALALCWLITMAGVAISRLTTAHDRSSLLTREARVVSAENRVATYRQGLAGVADDLKRRQDFIDRMVQAHLGDLPSDHRPGETISDSNGQAALTVRKVSIAIPEAAGLARIEARQLGFVERLTRYADRRAARDAAHMSQLGLDPRMMLASLDSGDAEGGPLLPLTTAADGSLDARFQRLGLSLARMDALEQGMQRCRRSCPPIRS